VTYHNHGPKFLYRRGWNNQQRICTRRQSDGDERASPANWQRIHSRRTRKHRRRSTIFFRRPTSLTATDSEQTTQHSSNRHNQQQQLHYTGLQSWNLLNSPQEHANTHTPLVMRSATLVVSASNILFILFTCHSTSTENPASKLMTLPMLL